MAIIYTYPSKAAAAQDKVLISDSADENKTKNASIDSIRDAINVVDVISAGPGISVSNPTGNVTIGNTGVLSLTAGSNISLSGSTGNITISTSASNVDGSGTAGKLPLWTDSNTIGDSNVTQNALNIGIGTTNPVKLLDVEGDVTFGSGNKFVTGVNVLEGLGPNGVSLRSGVSSALFPSFSNSDDTNTGMFLPGLDVLGLSTGGNERLRVTSAGNIGIGTTNPVAKMTIADTAPILRFINTSGGNNSYYMNVGMFGGKATIDAYTNSNAAAPLYFSTGGSNRMQLSATGNLSIGPFPGTEKLNVDGTVDLTNLKVSGAQGTNGQVLTSTGSGIGWQAAASPISGTAGVVPVFDALGTGIANSSLITTGSGNTQTFQFNTQAAVTFDGTILGTEGGTFSNSDLVTESTSALHIKGALKDIGNSTGSQGQVLTSNGIGQVQWRPEYNNGTINAGCASVGSSSNIASNPRQASFTFPNEVGSSNFGPCIPIMAPLTVQLIAIKWNGANAPVIGANGTVNFKLGKLTSRTGVPDTQEGTVNYTNIVDLTGLQITSADSGTWIYKFMNLAGLGATYVAQDIMVLLFPRPTTGWTGTGATNGDLQVTMQVAYA